MAYDNGTERFSIADKIDLHLLSAVLNPAIAIILIGGLLLQVNVAVLIAIGVIGYSVWGVINIMARKQDKKREEEARNRKKKKNRAKAKAARQAANKEKQDQ